MISTASRIKVSSKNVTQFSTNELAAFFFPAKSDLTHSRECLAMAKKLDISERKERNAQKNVDADKVRFDLIFSELKTRGVKTISKSGIWS